jgi:hypothetical protein
MTVARPVVRRLPLITATVAVVLLAGLPLATPAAVLAVAALISTKRCAIQRRLTATALRLAFTCAITAPHRRGPRITIVAPAVVAAPLLAVPALLPSRVIVAIALAAAAPAGRVVVTFVAVGATLCRFTMRASRVSGGRRGIHCARSTGNQRRRRLWPAFPLRAAVLLLAAAAALLLFLLATAALAVPATALALFALPPLPLAAPAAAALRRRLARVAAA